MDFLPGIEISAEFPHPGTLHILGYGIDPANAALQSLTNKLLEGRDHRNPKIIARLRELNVSITMQEVEHEAKADQSEKKKPIGRPHIAAILLRKGYVSSMKQAFDKYLAPGGLAYFDKERLTPHAVLSQIHEAGGLPVLAHPVQLRSADDAQLECVLVELKALGLAGLEVIHSDHDAALVEKYSALADKHGLLKTGGSDFHGTNKKDIDLGLANGRRVPREWMDILLNRLAAVHERPGTTIEEGATL